MMFILAFLMGPIGRWVAVAAVVMALWAGNSLYFYKKGEANVQRKWDAAVQAAIEKGKNARSDAERTIDAQPDGVRDPADRDQH